MSELLVRAPAGELCVTPASAGWAYVGFEVVRGPWATERETGSRELCAVAIEGHFDMRIDRGEWLRMGGRATPFDGPPEAVYLPPGTAFTLAVAAGAEVGLCWAPAARGAPARRLPGSEIVVEDRGRGHHARRVSPILMGDREAESLLVCEVITPAGHWSSYPPHKHDRHAPPDESFLEETYYHRIAPAQGFALQRVYTDDLALDETMVVRDRDCVLVPRGYHTVAAPPGYTVYYLNVMAGPQRSWSVVNDRDHDWVAQAGPD